MSGCILYIYYILYIFYIGGERRRRKADLDLAVVRLDRRREPGGGGKNGERKET